MEVVTTHYEFNVIDFVQKYIDEENAKYGVEYKVYDPPVWEFIVNRESRSMISKDDIPSMILMYFTVRHNSFSEDDKIYYMLVTSCVGTILYADKNLTLINTNYTLAQVKNAFAGWCRSALDDLGEEYF